MQATIKINGELESTPKAWVVRFQHADARFPTKVYVPHSHSEIKNGILYIAEWLLNPNRDGIGLAIRKGFACVSGQIVLEKPEQTEQTTPETIGGVISKGMFTVEATAGDEVHRTFKFKTSARTGKTVVGLLIGRDNTKDYAFFAYLNGSELAFFRSASLGFGNFVTLPVPNDVLTEYVKVILGDPTDAGKRYARESRKCSRCGKDLTHPESLTIGLGPECSGLGYSRKTKK